MRAFADACIAPPLGDLPALEAMAETTGRMGYGYVGLRISPADRMKASSLGKIFAAHGVSLATRLDIKERSRHNLLRQLRSMRDRYELIAVECTNTQVAMVAARDRRVDVMALDPLGRVPFTRSLAHVCRAALEVNFQRLLRPDGRPLLMSRLKVHLALASENDIDVVCASHARDRWGIRNPYDLAAACTQMGLEGPRALDAVSRNPMARILANRLKLSEDYISEGVRVIRRENAKAVAVPPSPPRV